MMRTRDGRVRVVGVLAASIALLMPCSAGAQNAKNPAPPTTTQPVRTIEDSDAHGVKEEFEQIFTHYPPALRSVLTLDPTLLDNQVYLASYPGLLRYLKSHPEISRNPTFYLGDAPRSPRDAASQTLNMWGEVYQYCAIFSGFALAAGVLIWLIRTLVDYRRWNRLAKVQADVHTKLVDRFTANEDLLAYIQSPAGSRFLESSPIKLDAAPRSMGAPLGRILWSLQGGLVLISGGIGMQIVGGRVNGEDAAQPLHALGVLAIALGIGFVVSAIMSYVISRRLGLIEPAPPAPHAELPNA